MEFLIIRYLPNLVLFFIMECKEPENNLLWGKYQNVGAEVIGEIRNGCEK